MMDEKADECTEVLVRVCTHLDPKTVRKFDDVKEEIVTRILKGETYART